MHPRAGAAKRSVCRYFASSGTCFYGDSCQFQHVQDTPGGPVGSGPPPRSQSAGPRHSSGGTGRPVSLAPSTELHKKSEPAAFQPRPTPPRLTSHRSHHASNPPKHRMHGVTRTGGVARAGGVALNPSTKPHRKKDLRGTGELKGLGGSGGEIRGLGGSGGEIRGLGGSGGEIRGLGGSSGEIRGLGGGVGVTTLQPPPASKQSVPRATPSPVPQSHVQSGGTTYFYSGRQPSFTPDYTSYTKPPSHLARGRSTHAPGFFVSEELRQELYQQQMACLSLPVSDDDVPKEVDTYHSLCPLEPVDDTPPEQESNRPFSHASTCYRAINQKDGLYYCLRRIHGCRLTNTKAVQELDKWRQLWHVNLVALVKMFTTKAFGDHSVVLVYDFHPASKTMKEAHLKHSKRMSPLPEDLVWEYIVQLASALRLIHGNHLALRCLDPSKILVTGPRRLRISCAGIVDILTFDAVSPPQPPAMHQQGDLFSLGQVMVCASLQSAEAGRQDKLHTSMEMIANTYTPELNHLLQYLLHSGSKGSPPHSVLEVISLCGMHIHSSAERALQREDMLKAELSREIQNGRLFRVLAKLGMINERPEFAGDEQWAETGDRYLLKLLRDYLFHQVLPSGAPWVNLAHIVQTLNKVDAGTYENISLHSRDEKSVLVVSYADLKACLEKTFNEVLSSPGQPSTTGPQGAGRKTMNGHSKDGFSYRSATS